MTIQFMKIIAICGSPRMGNTEFVLKRILTKLEEQGHQARLVLLREKRIQFCDGCLSCSETGRCKLRDNMQTIYSQLEESDLIIFGSPNYFSNVTGLMKNFIDRMFPLYYKNKLRDKKAVAVIVGAPDNMETIKKPADYIKEVADLLNMSFIGDFYLTVRESNEAENNPKSIEEISKFVENLAE